MNSEIPSIQEIISCLLSAIANAGLYGMKHPQVIRLVENACTRSSSILDEHPEITIVSIDNELIINGQHQEYNLYLNRFCILLKNNGISHLQLTRGVTREEIAALVTALARKEASGIASSEHVRTGQVGVRLASSEDESEKTVAAPRKSIPLSDMPKEELDRFLEIYDAIKKRKKLKITGITEMVTGFVDAFRQEGEALLVMASLRNTDEYTFTHSTNVCILNIAQAISLGIDGQLLRDIGIAAMLHDIGKLYIPEEIITKKDSLTPEEFDIMKRHPVLGAKHLLDTPGVPRIAITAAYEHHLKYNLSGYPQVSADWRPNLCSQMTMISDFFDALRTRRSYREPMELGKITDMMNEMSGKDFHPVLVSNFLKIIARLSSVIRDQ